MSEYKPSGLTHEIKTIEEFAAVVTKENLPFIMKDFQSVLEILLDMDDINKTACEIGDITYEKLTTDTFNWIDDGLHEMAEVTIQAKDDPETKIVFKHK